MIFDRFRCLGLHSRACREPATLTLIATAAAVGSAAIGAVGAITQGNAQKAAADRQAQIDQRNATLAMQDRQQAITNGELAAADKRRSDSRQLAAIRASFGSSGLELAGSPLDVLSDTATEMALDERRIAYQGTVQGRQDALRAIGAQEDAQSSLLAGNNAETAGYYGAGSSLLRGGSQALSYYSGDIASSSRRSSSDPTSSIYSYN